MKICIVGAGLAGCEAAWQLAEAGMEVSLFEMKPVRYLPAHENAGLGELVCSNSFRSTDENTGIGLLKLEMQDLGSLIMRVAAKCQVPAGKALAVDRALFSARLTELVSGHQNISLIREEIFGLDDDRISGFDRVVIAAGPLVDGRMAESILKAIGGNDLYFYDAIAPIVDTQSVDMDIAFWGARYDPDGRDYLNCPMNESEYKQFVAELVAGDKVEPRSFEGKKHFEGCLPIEVMAERGEMTLAFGPLKPVGIIDPRSGERPYAVIQLRPENKDKTALNMVGFQTKLKYPEQERIFRTIPGMKSAEFLRMGSIHRNTFVNAPQVLTPFLELKERSSVHLAGQISGVEGYLESAATGLWLGKYLGGVISGIPPQETALGGLLNHLQTAAKKFQPSNVHFGLMPALNRRAPKKKRKELYAKRAREAWEQWMVEQKLKG